MYIFYIQILITHEAKRKLSCIQTCKQKQRYVTRADVEAVSARLPTHVCARTGNWSQLATWRVPSRSAQWGACTVESASTTSASAHTGTPDPTADNVCVFVYFVKYFTLNIVLFIKTFKKLPETQLNNKTSCYFF